MSDGRAADLLIRSQIRSACVYLYCNMAGLFEVHVGCSINMSEVHVVG